MLVLIYSGCCNAEKFLQKDNGYIKNERVEWFKYVHLLLPSIIPLITETGKLHSFFNYQTTNLFEKILYWFKNFNKNLSNAKWFFRKKSSEMKYFDEDDIIQLKETFDSEVLKKIDYANLIKRYEYLISERVYFAKDILLEYLDLFLTDYAEFKNLFERLKRDLGSDYIEKLEQDISLLETYFYN